MWGYIHREPVPFREGNFEKMSSDTFNSYPSLSTVTHAEWRMTGAWQCNRTDRLPGFPVSQQYLSKSEPDHPVETIFEKSNLLPMCLCLCPRTDSSENSKSVGLVLKFRRKKPLQLLSYIFCSFLTYMEVNDYGISNPEEAFFGLQSLISPKEKHLPILRQQDNNTIAKTLAERIHSISINFQSIPKC